MAATVAMRECGWCQGNGEVQVGDLSVNPFSGIPVYDPELDAYAECWHCRGTGLVHDRSAPASKQGPQTTEQEGLR